MVSDPTLSFRLATYNLRYDVKPDDISVKESLAALRDPTVEPSYLGLAGKEQPWSSRRIRIAQDLLSEGIALAGFQEALIRQVKDMAELLGNDWAWIGVGRNGGLDGEFNPIFYKKSVFHLITWDTFWLSPTPFEVSVYPGAGCVRICTTASFQSQHSSKRITILNTHLDHLTDEPRKYGASLLLIRGKYEAARSKGPVLLTGDFNSAPTGHDSGAYEIVTGKTPPMEVNKKFREKYDPGPLNQLSDFKFLDIRTETPRFGVSGNFSTFTGWSPTVTDEWTRIDFIFGGNNREWKSTACKVGAGMSDDGMLHSDHRPVFADLII